METFTTDDIDACWIYHKDYLVDILNGEYDLLAAREDLRSLIGSKWDPRMKQENGGDNVRTSCND